MKPFGIVALMIAASLSAPASAQPPLALSLGDAIQRGLTYNLASIVGRESVEAARGARLRALADLLPRVGGSVARVEQQVNLEAFGFPLPPGTSPLIPPFGVWDARVSLSQAVVDLAALNESKAGARRLEAARYGYQDTRDLVVLVCTNLYLQAVAGSGRVDAARAELASAEALERLAADRKQAGLAAGIEVLRAQTQVETRRAQLIEAENGLEKMKLQLARAIGVPLDQPVTLADTVPYAPLASMGFDDALAQAYQSRSDYRQKQSLVAAADASRHAASAGYLPSFYVNANYGVIGPALGPALQTFSVAASVRVPIFEGGTTSARVMQTEAAWRQQQAELDDLTARIAYDVRAALLDLKAVDQELKTAEARVSLGDAQLAQATDRFKAGVASNLEVVEAQEAVATASESRISTLYAFNAAKATLARALGVAEAQTLHLVGEPVK